MSVVEGRGPISKRQLLKQLTSWWKGAELVKADLMVDRTIHRGHNPDDPNDPGPAYFVDGTERLSLTIGLRRKK